VKLKSNSKFAKINISVADIAGIAQGDWGNDPKASTRWLKELRKEWASRQACDE